MSGSLIELNSLAAQTPVAPVAQPNNILISSFTAVNYLIGAAVVIGVLMLLMGSSGGRR